MFWSIKNSGEVLNKLKSRGFRATSLSTYDCSTLYTTLPHNFIKEKLINLIEWTVHLILPVTKDRLSSLLKTQNDINFGPVDVKQAEIIEAFKSTSRYLDDLLNIDNPLKVWSIVFIRLNCS